MNKVLMHGSMAEMPDLSFLPNKNGAQSLIEVCRGMLVCQIDGEKEHYPFLAQGKVCGELMEAARRRQAVDVGGSFRHFCWENENLERHLSYYLLVTDIYCSSGDASVMVSEENRGIGQLVKDRTLFPVNLIQFEDLIRKLAC